VNLNVPVLLGFAFLDRGLFTCADHDAVVELLFPVIERKSARLDVAVDVKPSSPSPSAGDRSTVTAGSCAVFDSRPPRDGGASPPTTGPDRGPRDRCGAFAAWVLQSVAMAARYRMSSQRSLANQAAWLAIVCHCVARSSHCRHRSVRCFLPSMVRHGVFRPSRRTGRFRLAGAAQVPR
jgi:hypothetical protein